MAGARAGPGLHDAWGWLFSIVIALEALRPKIPVPVTPGDQWGPLGGDLDTCQWPTGWATAAPRAL